MMHYRTGTSFAVAGAVVLLSLATACSTDNDATGCTPRAIAFVGPLTGQYRRPPMQNGAELAVRLHNLENPDCPIGYLPFDSQGDPDLAERLADQIVDDQQIIAVIGPAYSGETAAVVPVLEKVGMANITASATNPTLSQQGWSVFHRIVGTDDAQGPAAAAFLREQLGVKRVAVIDDSGLYGKTLADLTAADLGRRGAVIAPRASLDPNRLDYTAVVESIAEIGADAVYFGGVTEPGVRLLKQMRDAGIDIPFMGGDGIFDSSLISGVGPGAQGAFVTCPCLDPTDESTPERKRFADEYRTYFGADPVSFAMEYYDAAQLVLAALASGAPTRRAVESWIDGTKAQGITKELRFGPSGDIEAGPIFVLRVEGDDFSQFATIIDGRVQLNP